MAVGQAWVKRVSTRDQDSRTEAQLAASFRIYTKLSMMVNDLASTLIQIEEMLKRPVDPRDESPTQRRVSAFAGTRVDSELFTAEELSVLVAANETDYLTELDLFGRRYDAFLRSLHTYGELKSKLHDAISESEEITFGPEDTLHTKTTAKNATKLRMQARTLESVIVPLINGLRHDTVLGVKLAKEYGPKMKKHFGNRRIPFFDFSELKSALPSLVIEEDDFRSSPA